MKCSFAILSACLFLSSSAFSTESPELIVQRVHAHLLIHDPSTAVQEAYQSLHQFPGSSELWQAYIRALAKTEDEKEMMSAWNLYAAHFPEPYENHELIEAMAWGVIEKGSSASSPLIRILALLAASTSQDAKGAEILSKHLTDPNSCVRRATVELCTEMRDAKLCDGVLRVFRHEKTALVRVAAIEAIGAMEIKSAKPDLVAIVANPKSSAEEKAAAIQSLVNMQDTADSEEIRHLATSNRAGLRLLACRAVSRLDLIDDLDHIYPLLRDSCSEVRAAAIGVFGSVGIKNYRENTIADLAAAMLADRDPNVAITAAWVLTLQDPSRGQRAFETWLKHEQQDIRIFAAGALSACGKYGLPLAQNEFLGTKDPYVRMNLAIGLIGQRMSIEPACEALCAGLMNGDERWAWQKKGDFQLLVPSKMSMEALSLESPIAMNQQVRLDVLNMVAMMHYGKAQEALSRCLEQRLWGVSGTAVIMLLTEGDEAALDLVRNLLSSPQDSVRVQAALILALWGRDEQVISLLTGAYEKADRDMKERILEGIGRIGAQSTLPFLVSKLQEPSQVLRIFAASALLQTLYH